MTPIRPSLKSFWMSLRRQAAAGALPAIPALFAAAMLVACGGGGPSAPTTAPSSTATVFASGPISGFGSVIINGVRFDVTAATIADDDGQALAEADLRLGMQADVDGDTHGDAARGTAHSIRVHSALVGPVSAVDATAGTITVLGQTVKFDAQAAFDTAIAGGLAGLVSGDVVAVHAQFDVASLSYLATRIQLDGDATRFKIRGTVTALDATTKTLQIGATIIDYSSVTSVPPTLAVGSLLVARLQTTAVAGVWTATAIADARPATHDHDEAHLRGVVSAFTSATQFSVDGNPVDATNAKFDNGQAAIALGVTVEVEGQLVNGVLIAREVTVDDEHARHDQDVELHGTIGALDTTALTFTLRGTTVSYVGTVEFDGGTVAALANGLFVEVKGGLSTDGTIVDATRIDLKPKD